MKIKNKLLLGFTATMCFMIPSTLLAGQPFQVSTISQPPPLHSVPSIQLATSFGIYVGPNYRRGRVCRTFTTYGTRCARRCWQNRRGRTICRRHCWEGPRTVTRCRGGYYGPGPWW